MAELTEIYARQSGSHVYTLAQQKGSRLRNLVTCESMNGEKRSFDRVKPTAARRVDSKYGDTPLIPTEFDRRTVHKQEFVWADMLDKFESYNVFTDPTSSIVAAGGFALGRVIDDVIIQNAFSGVAYEGKDGLTPVQFPQKQQIPITWGGTAGASTGLNVAKLLEIKSRFGKADIDIHDPENQLYLAVTQSQLDDLARDIDLRDRNYDAINRLLDGDTDKFLGITFVLTGRLPAFETAGGLSRMCAAWIKSGVVFASAKDITMEVNTRPDKNNNWQALGTLIGGATRIEDAKVQQIYCFEGAAA